MVLGFADQFEALFRTERAPQQRLDSDCFESAASGVGAFPPINAFQRAATSPPSSRCQASKRILSAWR